MAELERRIAQGRGDMPADMVLRGGRMLDLVTGDLLDGDVAICDGVIVGTLDAYDATEVIDVTGLTLVPGFIDTHLHIESSLVTPFEFDRCVTPRGVTTAICDPHEIANVIGADGIRYFQRASEHTLMDIRVQLSSCVPSTHMETAGSELLASDLQALMAHPSGIGLAEFMNYPGVIHRDPQAMEKLRLFEGGHIDGHCPLLSGRDLNAYIAAGIRTEHEATSAAEALEKLRKGMRVLIREGSVSKDMHALQPLLTERTAPYMCLCTDDRNPLDIDEHGHLDYMIRTMIALGTPPLAAYRAATLSAAEAFGLKDRGMIAPGKRADIVAIDSLGGCHAQLVIAGGRRVDDAAFAARSTVAPVGRRSVKASALSPAQFRATGNREATDVIGIREGQILTDHLHETIAIADGDKRPDPARDLVRIAVAERHGRNGNVATGFVKGFGLTSGAIASTVCHDHHNIACVGIDYDDMAFAANRLSQIEGGFVVVKDGTVLAELPLPIAGLMSLAPFEEVRDRLVDLRAAARGLGVTLEEPFLQLAFLALPVIPTLKITDRGMVDVMKFEIIPG
ncbi:adenosine deaminase [Salipiger aestuarii]|uniref:Adenine deaminase n=1 Tax=Salipiger aestuarii TaxID=568098 RepID=A0A327YTY3_9RHOB|nr:adenine deaminase [Salipiger aestuarii]KAA8610124.1 adenosine deaminase [Salipiger aestuarii]KAA8616069.1 adenosine deaminase [Salipiger aestuarii]KAB2543324.1 adenosine deaminase [Salipiger aestuarii]RAK24011.1 adenine deaminase [Salipiger aestuarii]